MRAANWSRALDIQMDYHKWCSSDLGMVYNYGFFQTVFEKAAEMAGRSAGNVDGTSAAMTKNVIEMLWRADTMYVTSDMLHVIMQAAHDLPEEAEWDEHVLITPNGFCLFEEPIEGDDRHGGHICIHGLGWNLTLVYDPDAQERHKVLMVYFFVDPHDRRDTYNDGFVKTMDIMGLSVPPITLQHIYPVRFGRKVHKQLFEEIPGAAIINEALKVFAAMHLIAQQRIGEPIRLSPDRATRKRAAKWDGQDRVITLITLRRKSVKRDDEEPMKVEWSRRWLVKGHWRKQYFPKSKTHDWVYIFGYVKGPEDKPLVVTERRVFDFRR